MKKSLYRFENKNILTIKEDLSPEQWEERVDWVEISTSNREQVADLLKGMPFIKEGKNNIVSPDDHPIPKTINEFIIQNLVISSNESPYKPEYLTIIVSKSLIITIIPESSGLGINQNEPNHLIDYFTDLKFYFSFIIVSKIYAKSYANMGIARKRLHTMENILLNNPEKLKSLDVMSTKSDISQLADIIEDQFVGLDLIISLFESEEGKPDSKKLKEVLDGFKELNRMMTRLEEKAESFRTQFMLIHQEETAHKINLLTILQAIFIPLTFIAGVYGMNFKYMPELTWPHAYYVVWSGFIILAGILLYYFKKTGWFK